jgi:hypothetical protein
MKKHPKRASRPKGLRLKANDNGTFTDQYGRVLERYVNDKGQEDLRPTGLDPKGARH